MPPLGRPAGSDPPETAAGPPTARLVIEEPRLRDEALYKCDVTYVKGKCPSISLVRLQMMSLPSRALISLASNQGGSTGAGSQAQSSMGDGQLLGPYREEEFLQLVCLVSGGRPAPKSVSWRRVDPAGRLTNLVSSKQVHRGGQASQVETLLSHQLTRADLGAKFECHVEHEALELGRKQVQELVEGEAGVQLSGRDSTLDLHPALPPTTEAPTLPDSLKQLDAHVFIDLNVGVASVDLFVAKANRRNLSEPLREGDLVELECVAYNARPAANITWFNGQERIEPLELGSAPSELTSTRGQLRHKRLLQRHQVHQNSDGHTYDTHSFLSIKVSRYENRARIWCNASNGLPASSGGEQVRALELEVQYAPVVLMEPASGIQVDEEQVLASSSQQASGDLLLLPVAAATTAAQNKQQVSVYCIYSAHPSQLAAGLTRWFKDGRPLELASDARLSESHTATGYPVLSIRQVSRRDAGSYECQLANALGVSERLAPAEQCRLQVNFRPSVRLRVLAGATPDASTTELDTGQELVEPGQSFSLHCDVLEARPNRMEKFHWYRWDAAAGAPIHSQAANLIGVTDSGRFQVGPLGPEFGGAAFACAAFNSLGPSERSNHIELRLSHTPGASHVRAVSEPSQRKWILQSGRANPQTQTQPQPHHPGPGDAGSGGLLVAASRPLMLECITPNAGQPAANSWLWFKDGQPLDTQPYEAPHRQSNANNAPSKQHYHSPSSGGADSGSQDNNPISDLEESLSADNHLQSDQEEADRDKQATAYRTIGRGRYLFMAAIQLGHRGNYSCLALNRMGPSREPPGRQLQLALARAPSFVQSLGPRTYWPEVRYGDHSQSQSRWSKENQVELVCQVQCEPICQLEWLRNNEPLRLNIRRQSTTSDSLSAGSLVTHQLTQSLIDENPRLNVFRSVESRLKLIFHQPADLQAASGGARSNNNNQQQQQRGASEPPPDWLRERRNYLSSTNYTCQSSANPFGGPVRSSTRVMVQYPPERLLISSGSGDDKLSLVEGEPGPRLSCQAEGEPQVQYRWFFLRAPSDQFGAAGPLPGTTMASSQALLDLEAGKPPPSWSSLTTTTYGAQPPEQPPSGRSLQPAPPPPTTTATTATAPLRGANDIQWGAKELIELTGPTLGGHAEDTPTGSQLNLAAAPMHRKQAGHYICEASNWLGRSRQSVFVNVLYKPTCATLHLFSLDSTQVPGLVAAGNGAKPASGATTNHEYSLVRETSEDYVDLRKLLVLAPLLSRAPADLELPFKDSIFHTILRDTQESGRLLEEAGGNFGTLRGWDGLINREPAGSETSQVESLAHIEKENVGGGGGAQHRKQDSWHKFNALLLNFINSYSRQIKRLEPAPAGSKSTNNRVNNNNNNKQQNRRSLSSQYEASDELVDVAANRVESIIGGANSSRNLLTFACVARDANPMNNLSFSWSFGSSSLPRASDSEMELGGPELDSSNAPAAPLLASHSYANYSVHVWLVKRLDVQTSLNPFQFSLVTLNVIVEPMVNDAAEMDNNEHTEDPSARLKRRTASQRGGFSSSWSSAGGSTHRAGGHKSPSIDVAEMNWEEYIGQMLNCRIANQMGASEACPANINLAERYKSRQSSSSSSSSEFANWRMPAMATKSLLIIAISVCCSLIVLATLFLVASPHLKELIYSSTTRAAKTNHHRQPAATRYAHKSPKELVDTNTGSQSTSSQKSSVLGLLGPDSSLQGSSDDDSSARVPVSQPERQQQQQQHNRVASPMLDLDDAATLARANFLRSQSGSAYDRPRDLRSNNQQQQQQPPVAAKKNSLQSRLNSFCKTKSSELTLEPLSSAESRALASSASSRFLESLKFKSLSKFARSDRITDRAPTYLAHHPIDTQHNIGPPTTRNLHSKNLSNAETVTTGLSDSFRDARERASQRGTPVSKYLAAAGSSPSAHHYQHPPPFKRAPSHLINRAEANQFLNSLHDNSASSYLMQLNLRGLLDAPHSMSSSGHGAPAYSNLTYLDPSSITEEHHRQPTWAVDDNLYLSQVDPMLTGRTTTTISRNPLKQPVFTVEDGGLLSPHLSNNNNNNSYTSQHTPVFYGSSSLANYQPADARPASSMNFRTSYRQQVMNLRAADQQYHSLMNNRFSMPPIHAPPPPLVATQTNNNNNNYHQQQHTTTTIDTHLERMNDVLTNGLLHSHNADPQIAYANTLNRNSYLPIACYGTPTSGVMSPPPANNKPVEHIYDLNAYATPEQTPVREPTNTATKQSLNDQSTTNSRAIERPRVSQLIQSFNSKAPE